jgi:excinuclease UvrABC nuclease subunit
MNGSRYCSHIEFYAGKFRQDAFLLENSLIMQFQPAYKST